MLSVSKNVLLSDVVDWIVENLIDNTRSRRTVLWKLREMSLILTDYKPKKKSSGRAKASQTWGADEEAQLAELYEEFKDAPGECLGVCMDVCPTANLSASFNKINPLYVSQIRSVVSCLD